MSRPEVESMKMKIVELENEGEMLRRERMETMDQLKDRIENVENMNYFYMKEVKRSKMLAEELDREKRAKEELQEKYKI